MLTCVVGFLADHVDRIEGGLSEELMELKSEQGPRVVRGKSWNEILNLVMDADYDGNSVLAKVRVGWHGA
jgi:hypothetical protein